MIGYEHKIPRGEFFIDAAAGIRDHDGSDAELAQNIDRKADFPHGQSFVIMIPALHQDDFFPVQFSEYESVGVSGDMGNREPRNILIRYIISLLNLFTDTSQPAAENHSRLRPVCGSFADIVSCSHRVFV